MINFAPAIEISSNIESSTLGYCCNTGPLHSLSYAPFTKHNVNFDSFAATELYDTLFDTISFIPPWIVSLFLSNPDSLITPLDYSAIDFQQTPKRLSKTSTIFHMLLLLVFSALQLSPGFYRLQMAAASIGDPASIQYYLPYFFATLFPFSPYILSMNNILSWIQIILIGALVSP